MRPYIFLSACIFHIAAAQVGSGAAAILAGVQDITNDMTTMNNTLNTFDGGLVGTLTALQIQGESQSLLSDINNLTATVNATAPLNQKDSVTVTNSVVGLQPYIYSLLDNLDNHHQAFETAILGVASATSLVESDLKNLQNATMALGNAVISKLIPELQSLAPLVTYQIDFHFQRSIQLYSS